MRQPAIRRTPRGIRSSISDSIPAPTGGWNVRDPLAAMSPKDAIWLENWWPGTGKVELRKGARYHAEGLNGKVDSLMAYNAASSAASGKLFAATPSKLYDVSAAGAAPVEIKTVLNGRFRHAHFSPVGTNYLIAVNGADPLQAYDGTTWKDITAVSTPAITGLATTELVNVAVFKRKLWFVQKNSMSAWYLPTDQIAGTLTEFPVGQLFSMGGYLIGLESWTIDGGFGPDDYLVFLSSEGEVAVYRGTDPATLGDFSLVGIAYIGKPLGPNSILRMGGEVLILTETGLFPLSRSYRTASVSARDSISSKIDPKLSEVAEFYRNSYGWDLGVFPGQNALIVNVPTAEGISSAQLVMNTLTGAWALFSGWNAFCWETVDSGVFFGGDGYVAQAFSGTDDFGKDIMADGRTAFSYLGSRRPKHFKLCRPVIHASDRVLINFAIDVDFNEVDTLNFVQQGTGGSGGGDAPLQAQWDTAIWDASIWGDDSVVSSYWWTAFSGPGFCLSARLRIITKGVTLGWSSTDAIYQQGNGL